MKSRGRTWSGVGVVILLAVLLCQPIAAFADRFIDNNNGTVTDTVTNLVWLKNASPCGNKDLNGANAYCSSLASGTAGLTDGSVAGDWRLPSKVELQSIGTEPPATWYSGPCPVTWTKPGAPFTNVEYVQYYLSSTRNDDYWYDAWDINMGDSIVGWNNISFPRRVWPVRGPIETTTTTTPISTTSTTVVIDTDVDGISDDIDNCSNNYNPDQADSDSNGIGDRCDTDYLWAALQECLNPPANIELSVLDAIPSDKQVIFKWKTETEAGNAGFNVWRADNFLKINPFLIPALGSSVSGLDYDFVDERVLNGKRYFYLLEDIDTDGISTFHGPVKAVPRMIYGIGK
jgi:hypothetical protein